MTQEKKYSFEYSLGPSNKEKIQEKPKKNKKKHLEYFLLGIILWFGYKIRTSNLHLLKDKVTGKFIMADPDATGFLRYIQHVAEHGQMMVNDALRYHPIGFTPGPEFTFFPHIVAKFYHILHFFNDKITVEYAAVIFPAVGFVISGFFFYLTIKELLGKKTALIATGLLATLPAFIFRTMAGVTDKEALSTVFFFIATYLITKSWQQKTTTNSVYLGILLAAATIAMALTWGGVKFLLIIYTGYVLIEIILDKFSNNELYTYIAWFTTFLIFFQFIYPYSKYFFFGQYNMITSVAGQMMLLALAAGIIRYTLQKKEITVLKNKIPQGILSIILAAATGAIFVTIWLGPDFLMQKIQQFYNMFNNTAASRWILTVEESRQPYVTEWFTSFTKEFLAICFAGIVMLFYHMVKPIKEHQKQLTAAFTVCLAAFIFNRYSSTAKILNGESSIATVLYVGSIAVLLLGAIGYYVYCFKKKPEIYKEILKINKMYPFLLIWLILGLAGARTAVRLIFFLAPVTAIFGAYACTTTLSWAKKQQKRAIRIVVITAAIYLLFSTTLAFSTAAMNNAENIGSKYTVQWQKAMDWVQHNTPEDAVFAHWWDYGYLVQTGARRATISDGGNARGAINYFTGRHLLTETDDKKTLEFLYANEVTHILMVAEDIGKYGAYSAIGSDANYDRRSYIQGFNLKQEMTTETDDGFVLTYLGQWISDADIPYKRTTYPKGEVSVEAIFIETQRVTDNKNNTAIIVTKAPTAGTVYNKQRIDMPIDCIYINGEEKRFNIKQGLKGCVFIIPRVTQQLNPIGTALYIPEKVYASHFTKLYLLNKETENFKKVYSDEIEIPIANIRGNAMGPLKIWEVTYPDDIQDIPMYRATELPDANVQEV